MANDNGNPYVKMTLKEYLQTVLDPKIDKMNTKIGQVSNDLTDHKDNMPNELRTIAKEISNHSIDAHAKNCIVRKDYPDLLLAIDNYKSEKELRKQYRFVPRFKQLSKKIKITVILTSFGSICMGAWYIVQILQSLGWIT